MSSSSHSPSAGISKRFAIEEECRWCKCGARSFAQVARTQSNYGRRFFSCPNYKGEKKCNFFAWKDPPFVDQAQDVINGLCEEKKKLCKQVDLLRKKEAQANYSVDLEEVADSRSRIEVELEATSESCNMKEIKLKELKKKLQIREEKLQIFEEKLREREEKIRAREATVKKREDKCAIALVICLLVILFIMLFVMLM